MMGIDGQRVLIVEDEYLLAHDLSRYFREMGAVVLGPASSLDAAGPQVAYADAAILDIDLNGQAVFPPADEFGPSTAYPFLFYTGRSDIVILPLPVLPASAESRLRPKPFANVRFVPHGSGGSENREAVGLPDYRRRCSEPCPGQACSSVLLYCVTGARPIGLSGLTTERALEGHRPKGTPRKI